MRKNMDKSRRDQTVGADAHTVARPPDYTAEQWETARRGLRILAKIIARAHLRRQAVRCGAIPAATNGKRPRAAPHGPAQEGEAEG